MPQPAEDDDGPELRIRGRALATLRREAGMSQEQAGEAFGVSGQNFAKYELGKAPSMFYPSVERRLLRAVGATAAAWRRALAEAEQADDQAGVREPGRPYVYARSDGTNGGAMAIRDRIQAAWVSDAAGGTLGRTFPASRDPRYPNAEQWLAEIVDASAEGLSILPGDLAHCVDADAIGYYPKTGDIVEVERRRDDGEREITLKQVEQTSAGVLLWPRPGQGGRRDPIPLADNDTTTRIRALVTLSLRRY